MGNTIQIVLPVDCYTGTQEVELIDNSANLTKTNSESYKIVTRATDSESGNTLSTKCNFSVTEEFWPDSTADWPSATTRIEFRRPNGEFVTAVTIKMEKQDKVPVGRSNWTLTGSGGDFVYLSSGAINKNNYGRSDLEQNTLLFALDKAGIKYRSVSEDKKDIPESLDIKNINNKENL